ncbi:MAG TPA: hypothetical protein VMB35_08200 [Methanomicrobiales archaeon]|nr:hypothetical protein [Methanomicrobiales archaeon]
MIHPPQASMVPGPAVSWGGRLFVPLIRRTCMNWGGGGFITGVPVALLIREEGAWSFVPLIEGVRQDILSSPGLSFPAGLAGAAVDPASPLGPGR